YETVELGVVAGEFETQWSRRPPQPDLDGFCGFEAEIGIADVERRGGIVPAARKQFGGFGCAFDVLTGYARNEIPREILDQANARALRREIEVAGRGGADGGGIDVEIEDVRNESRCHPAQIGVLDAPGNLCFRSENSSAGLGARSMY